MPIFATTAAPSTTSTPTRDKDGCLKGEVWDDIDRICRTDPNAISPELLSKLMMTAQIFVPAPPLVLAPSPVLVPGVDPKVSEVPPPPAPPTDVDPKLGPAPAPPTDSTGAPLPLFVPPASSTTGAPLFAPPDSGSDAPSHRLPPDIVLPAALVAPAAPKKGINPLYLLGGAALIVYLVTR
jgi:hypothetical protein